jgi:hypothetical protein
VPPYSKALRAGPGIGAAENNHPALKTPEGEKLGHAAVTILHIDFGEPFIGM